MRKRFLTKLYLHTQKLYTSLFKTRKRWRVTREDLLQSAPHTLGHQLGLFLKKHDFDLIPKVEQHDVYHVLTGYGISVEDEIALQFLCLGNGKRSFYLFGVIVIGSIVLPEHLGTTFNPMRRGAAFHLSPIMTTRICSPSTSAISKT